jgi:integrase
MIAIAAGAKTESDFAAVRESPCAQTDSHQAETALAGAPAPKWSPATRRIGSRMQWKTRHFLRTVSKIRKAAGIDPAIKFMGLRHSGNTEGGDANLTDAQLRALSGHKSRSMTQLYTQKTVDQRRVAARLWPRLAGTTRWK